MRRAEKERLQKLYLTQVDAAMKKRSLGYRLLAEAEEEMIAAREILANVKGEKRNGTADGKRL